MPHQSRAPKPRSRASVLGSVSACILNPHDVLEPLSDAVLVELRARIFEDGICAQDFETLLAREDAAFQKVFGGNVLLKLEFDVAFIGEHSHLVFVPAGKAHPETITAYPQHGKLRVHGPAPWGESMHSPHRRKGEYQRLALIATGFTEADWRRISVVACAIDEAGLNYNFLFQNSNSVVATLSNVAKTGFVDLPGGGINMGSGNLLFDELMGGRQAPKLLVRGGTSHSGPLNSPAPRHLPESAGTDG